MGDSFFDEQSVRVLDAPPQTGASIVKERAWIMTQLWFRICVNGSDRCLEDRRAAEESVFLRWVCFEKRYANNDTSGM